MNWKKLLLKRNSAQLLKREKAPAPNTPYRNCSTCFYQQMKFIVSESLFDRSQLQNRRVSFFYFRFSFRIFYFWAFEVITQLIDIYSIKTYKHIHRNIGQLWFLICLAAELANLITSLNINSLTRMSDLCQLTTSKYPHPQSSITLSYYPLTTLSPLPAQYLSITTLSLNHCELNTLRGIQQFPHLISFSFKFNNIAQAKQLSRLTCTQTLTSLNFIGNDIEYLEDCRYEKLVKRFSKLTEVNNVDYRFHRVVAMAKKKEIIPKSKIQNKLEELEARTKRYTEPGLRDTSRKENSPENNLENISISRVQMVKSVVTNPNQPVQKKRNLLISTANVQNIPVYQPTATFARQKTIQQTGFPFRKQPNLIQLLDRRDDQDMCISRNSALGFCGTSMALFPDLKEEIEQYQEASAEAHYQMYLRKRVLHAWLQARNLPVKRHFY